MIYCGAGPHLLPLESKLKVYVRPDASFLLTLTGSAAAPASPPCLSLLFYLLKRLWASPGASAICPPCPSSSLPALVCVTGRRPLQAAFPRLLDQFWPMGGPGGRYRGKAGRALSPQHAPPTSDRSSAFVLWFQFCWCPWLLCPSNLLPGTFRPRGRSGFSGPLTSELHYVPLSFLVHPSLL